MLAITLLILLVVTVVGVAGMNSSGIQIFLARNNQYKNISFQNAESAVLIGETTWHGALTGCFTDPGSCTISNRDPVIIDDVDDIDWESGPAVFTSSYDKYNVEKLREERVPSDPLKRILTFRITARGQGPNSKAQTRVQTIYRICKQLNDLDDSALGCGS